jgi:hypothetical protein
MTDHYRLMTATPHKEDPENFCRFLALLDADAYGNIKSLEEAMRRGDAPFYLRRTKEALVSFPDPTPERSRSSWGGIFGRVAPGDCSPEAPTDPDVPN